MMYLWLSSAENNNIPSYAHTMIGVGAVVVNNQDQVLVVKEKYQFYNRPLWKLPGGHVEPGLSSQNHKTGLLYFICGCR